MDPRIYIDRTRVLLESDYRVGVVLTQLTPAETWSGTAEARERANGHVEVMRSAWFVQHLGTWGIDLSKVWPAPGVFDWTLFDRRMDWIVARGIENVVIGCYGAPSWATIKGKHPVYQQLNPAHEGTWAHFCAMAIERALERGVPVKVATCWNELKGDGTYGGDWDIVAYTRRYNTWYTTLRSYPGLADIQLAGPYFPIENARDDDAVITDRNLATLDHWYEHAIDADLIAVDHALSHAGTAPITRAHAMAGVAEFGSIVRQLQARYPSHRVMMMEGYPQSDLKLYADYDIHFQAAW